MVIDGVWKIHAKLLVPVCGVRTQGCSVCFIGELWGWVNLHVFGVLGCPVGRLGYLGSCSSGFMRLRTWACVSVFVRMLCLRRGSLLETFFLAGRGR